MFDQAQFDQIVFDGSVVTIIHILVSDAGLGIDSVETKTQVGVSDSGQGVEMPSRINQIGVQDKNLPSVSYF